MLAIVLANPESMSLQPSKNYGDCGVSRHYWKKGLWQNMRQQSSNGSWERSEAKQARTLHKNQSSQQPPQPFPLVKFQVQRNINPACWLAGSNTLAEVSILQNRNLQVLKEDMTISFGMSISALARNRRLMASW